MATQLLFYESALPVSSQRHANWSVEVGADYAFTRNVKHRVELRNGSFPPHVQTVELRPCSEINITHRFRR